MRLPLIVTDNLVRNCFDIYLNGVMNNNACNFFMANEQYMRPPEQNAALRALKLEFEATLRTLPSFQRYHNTSHIARKNPTSFRNGGVVAEFLGEHRNPQNERTFFLFKEILHVSAWGASDVLTTKNHHYMMHGMVYELFVLNYIQHRNILSVLNTECYEDQDRYRLTFLPHITLTTVAHFAWNKDLRRESIFDGDFFPRYILKHICTALQHLYTYNLWVCHIDFDSVFIAPDGKIRLGQLNAVDVVTTSNNVLSGLGGLYLAMCCWRSGFNPENALAYGRKKIQECQTDILRNAMIALYGPDNGYENWSNEQLPATPWFYDNDSEIRDFIDYCCTPNALAHYFPTYLANSVESNKQLSQYVMNLRILNFYPTEPKLEERLFGINRPIVRRRSVASRVVFKFEMRNGKVLSVSGATVVPNHHHSYVKAAIEAVPKAFDKTLDPYGTFREYDLLTVYATIKNILAELEHDVQPYHRQTISPYALTRTAHVSLGVWSERLLTITAMVIQADRINITHTVQQPASALYLMQVDTL